MTKRGLIILLAGVNLFLLAAIVFTAYTPPSALAQAVGARRGEYLLLAGRGDVANDAIYLIDSGGKKLHVFRSLVPRAANGATDVGHAFTYDLMRDFVGPPGGGAAPGQALPNQQPLNPLIPPPAGGPRP